MAQHITKNKPNDIAVNILGSIWKIVWRTKEEDVHLAEVDGYCDHSIKTIVINWFEYDGMNLNDMAEYSAKVVRHEMIHAMLHECGLDCNTHNNWARNEEMVDWIAIQLPKMYDLILPISTKIKNDLEKDINII